MKRWILFITATLGLSIAARGAEMFEYHRPTRALGMGGVYLPFTRPTDAVMWNPAELANVSGIHWELIGLDLALNPAGYNEYNILYQAGCTTSACYEGYYGVPLWANAQGSTSLVFPRLGFTAFDSFFISGELHNPAFPSFNLTYLNDTGMEVGYGFPIYGALTAGVTLKKIMRQGGTQDISLSTITSGAANFQSQFNQHGTAYGFDLAMEYKLDGFTIASHWQDVGGTSFLDVPGVTSPDMIYDNFSVGVGSEMSLPGLDLRGGLEFRHLRTQGEQFGKKVHIGTELGLPLIDIQAGINEGYLTEGIGIDLWLLRFEAAHFTEETGIYPGQSPSERYQATLSLDISIDANFNYSALEKDGSRRHLKQRR